MRILSGLFMMLATACAYAAEITPVDKVDKYVNIRSGPDAGSDVVGRLNRGETLPSPETVDGWFRVELPDGGIGYVHADWAEVLPAAAGEAEAAAVADDAAATAGASEAEPEAAADDDGETTAELAAEADAEITVPVPAEEEPADAPAAADTFDEPQPESATADTEVEPIPEPTPVVEPKPAAEPEAPVSPIRGQRDFVVRFKTESTGTSSQIYDDGNVVGIGTTAPQQRLEVNGSIQIHDQHSSVAGLMITQSSGETGYILHNRASTLTIGAGSVDRITIDRAGNVGIAVARPEHPLHVANGAYLSAGGVWTNSSSRQGKEGINSLDAESALAAVMALEPVSFRYRADTAETHLGFIAEDVPDLVATADRSGLSAMDIVAALTRVIQEQEKRIATLEKALADTGH